MLLDLPSDQQGNFYLGVFLHMEYRNEYHFNFLLQTFSCHRLLDYDDFTLSSVLVIITKKKNWSSSTLLKDLHKLIIKCSYCHQSPFIWKMFYNNYFFFHIPARFCYLALCIFPIVLTIVLPTSNSHMYWKPIS